MDARIARACVEGEIRLGLFIVVRSHSLQARVGTTLFGLRRHFSLFILRAATYIATFFRGKPFTASNRSQFSQDRMALDHQQDRGSAIEHRTLDY